MNVRKILTAAGITALLGISAAAAATAFAYGQFAQISGQQAAAAATAHVGGGYAEDVEFEYGVHTGGRYEVEVQKDNREYKVWVDADSGKMLSSREEFDGDRREERYFDELRATEMPASAVKTERF